MDVHDATTEQTLAEKRDKASNKKSGSGGASKSGGAAGAATSGSREESMDDQGGDKFGPKDAETPPDPEDQGDGAGEESADSEGGDETRQNPASSGTTSLGGEPRDADSIRGSGGIEGTG